MTAFHILLLIILAFTALALLCAVWIGLRPSIPQADPFFQPFGDMPGFTSQQIDAMSKGAMENAARDPLRRSFVSNDNSLPPGGRVVRPDDGGGRLVPSGSASICNFPRRGRDA